MKEKIIHGNKKKRIFRNERHIRYNWEPSPREMSGNREEVLRFHFVFIGNKQERETYKTQIYEQFTSKPFSSPIEIIRTREYKVINSNDVKALFVSFDTYMSHINFNPKIIKIPVKRDFNLRERIRKGCSIENYVESFYGSKSQ